MRRDEDRYKSLPDRPAQYTPLKGSYREVSNAAVGLNEAQLRSDFLDYLFFPEVETAPHGDVEVIPEPEP